MADELDRDPFELFGSVEDAPAPARTPAPAAPRAETRIPAPGPAFSLAAFVAGLAAPLWLAGAIGAAIAYFGAEALFTLDPTLMAALAAGVFGPALLFWAASSAAGDAASARKLTLELARLAHASHLPLAMGGAEARQLGSAVREELNTLCEAVSDAMGRLASLEDSAKRSAALFGAATHESQDQVAAMTAALRREREALMSINGELREQSEAVGETVSRQVRLMREASKIVKSEVAAAEAALQSHLQRFTDSAGAVAEQTDAFHEAAEQAASVTASLTDTLADMLDSMSEATRLADAARKSSEQAVMIANDTAGALRETTRSAVFEAQRAAQLMRAETQALQHSAADTLARLQQAAQAAREASEESQAAANRHAGAAMKRLHRDRGPDAAPRHEPSRKPLQGFGAWGNYTPRPTRDSGPETANDGGGDLVDFGAADPDLVLRDGALELVSDAGVALDDVLRTPDLEHIARRSRDGASARRAAVRDAAPGAVTRIARHVRHNTKAHMVANEFRARPDLAKSERKSESSNLVRAYLLIDAALA